MVKTTKCRQYVHTYMSREVVPDTPTGHRSKLLLVSVSSSGPRGTPDGILNGLVFRGFTRDYD